MNISAQDCQNLDCALNLEWLETNGRGGFSSGTVAGANTRRYHALLLTARKPPSERFVLVNQVEEWLDLDGQSFPLSTNCYPGAVHPSGYQLCTGFTAYSLANLDIRVPQHNRSNLRSSRSDGCLGQVSEIFDAEAPHYPRGCYAQAWSVAEPFRALIEDLGISVKMLQTPVKPSTIRQRQVSTPPIDPQTSRSTKVPKKPRTTVRSTRQAT